MEGLDGRGVGETGLTGVHAFCQSYVRVLKCGVSDGVTGGEGGRGGGRGGETAEDD